MAIRLLLIMMVAGLFLVGCDDLDTSQQQVQPPQAKAFYTAKPINVDGELSEPVWQKAVVYELKCPQDRLANGDEIHQPGSVRFAWDDKYFYVAGKFTDLDIQANGDEDGMHHYSWGDVMELFLWPADNSWYWELYCTPLAKKSTFFFPAPGHLGMKSCFEYKFDLKVAAKVNGSVKKWNDEDKGWTCEMAVPISELTKRGEKFGPASDWRLLIGRYNWCVKIDRTGAELSSFPQLTKTSYHLRDEYAKILFVK